MQYFILPGYGNSGPGHWQSLWEKADPRFRRIDLGDWEAPRRETWIARLEAQVAKTGSPIVLIAHSLACLLVAAWAREVSPASVRKIKAALLVAPVDPDGPAFPASAVGFSPVPVSPLPFPGLLVASGDDPYSDPEGSRRYARGWGTAFVDIGKRGHINSDSGLGDWPQGRDLLASLLNG